MNILSLRYYRRIFVHGPRPLHVRPFANHIFTQRLQLSAYGGRIMHQNTAEFTQNCRGSHQKSPRITFSPLSKMCMIAREKSYLSDEDVIFIVEELRKSTLNYSYEEFRHELPRSLFYLSAIRNPTSPASLVLLDTLADIINASDELTFESKAIGVLYGLKGFRSSHLSVRKLLKSVTQKLSRCSFKSNVGYSEVAMSMYGMQRMSANTPEVRELLTVLKTIIAQCQENLSSRAVGNAFYGMHNMRSEYIEVRNLVKVLTQKAAKSEELLNVQEISNAFYGMQKMDSNHREVQEAVRVLTTKLQLCPDSLSPQAIGNMLYGMQRMNSENATVRSLLVVLTEKISASNTQPLSQQEMCNALYGIGMMRSDRTEVRNLLKVLTEKVTQCKEVFTPAAIVIALYGLRSMWASNKEVRNLLAALAIKINNSEAKLTGRQLSTALFGLQRMNSEHIEVKQLLSALCNKMDIEEEQAEFHRNQQRTVNQERKGDNNTDFNKDITSNSRMDLSNNNENNSDNSSNETNNDEMHDESKWNSPNNYNNTNSSIQFSRFGPQAVSSSLFGLRWMSGHHAEVQQLLRILVPLIKKSDQQLSSKQIYSAMLGLQKIATDETKYEIDQLLVYFTEQLDRSTQPFSLEGITMILYGVHNINCNSPQMRAFLDVFAKKISNLLFPLGHHSNDYDTNHTVEQLSEFSKVKTKLALQSMDRNIPEVNQIHQLLMPLIQPTTT